MKIPTGALLALLLLGACSGPSWVPPGAQASAKTEVLKAGAKLLQSRPPITPITTYLIGFHPMKDDPSRQMEAHHYCHQVNEDFAQCVLFDGNSEKSNLNGIEYIISEKLFNGLPAEEKPYWHPHNGEILSGQLVAPGLPEAAEKELMRGKMNSYGKTWHVWMAEDKLPYGKPMLAWSINRDGEAKPGLVEYRDKKLGIRSELIRNARAELRDLAKPQAGVDALRGKFDRPTTGISGVVDRKADQQ